MDEIQRALRWITRDDFKYYVAVSVDRMVWFVTDVDGELFYERIG